MVDNHVTQQMNPSAACEGLGGDEELDEDELALLNQPPAVATISSTAPLDQEQRQDILKTIADGQPNIVCAATMEDGRLVVYFNFILL